jgi:hypothetical protein
MARIQTYDNDLNVTLDDKVIGTDAVDNSTKNFTVGDILALGTSGTTYIAGTGIDITDGVITCTVSDTNTDAQTLSMVGTVLSISGGNSINFAPFLDNTDEQTLSFSGTTLSISNGNSVDLASLQGSSLAIPEILIGNVAYTINAVPDETPLEFILPADDDISVGSLLINWQGKLSIGSDWVRNDAGQDLNVKITMHGFTVANGNNLDISYILKSSPDGINWTNVKTVERTKSAPGEYADMFGAYFRMRTNEYFRVTVASSTGGIDLLAGSQLEFIVY